MVDIDAARGIADRLAAVRVRVEDAARASGRDPSSVRVLLATKTQPLDVVRAAILAGGTLIGENRVHELVDKGPGLADLTREVHLIGHLQSNKVNRVLPWTTCVQTVDSVDLARRLASRASDAGRVLDVLIQVKTATEDSKQGLDPAQLPAFLDSLRQYDSLRPRGLMTLATHSDDAGEVRRCFRRLRECRDQAAALGHVLPRLSMGMSGDFPLAIAEGATEIRIGTAIFGQRTYPDPPR